MRCTPLFILSWFILGLLGTGESHADSPNVIMVMCDDLGWGDVGFNGGMKIKTPCLDEMASHSMRFSRFYAQAPVCSPTRGSCLTGRHPYRYGVFFANTGHMKTEELTLAELLREKGYTTGHFGKWHLGTLTTELLDANRGGKPQNAVHYSPPQENGFEVCFSTESKVPTFDPMIKPSNKAGNEWNAIEDKSTAVEYGTFYWDERGQRATDNLDGDDSRIIMDRAVPFIREAASKEQPFFAVIWFHTPHLPVVADAEHRALYPDAKNVRHANYMGCVSAMDEQIGRLRETLRECGVAENTIVTFCSDNGPEGNDQDPGSAGPFRGRKRSLYEGGIRVPALIEWPARIQHGSQTDFAAVTSDYLPTILEIVGAVSVGDRPIDGVSLLPVVSGEQMERPSPIGFQSAKQSALSDNQYKIYRAKDGAAWELYDLLADPSERHNLAEQHRDVVVQMSGVFDTWQASCAASNDGADYAAD